MASQIPPSNPPSFGIWNWLWGSTENNSNNQVVVRWQNGPNREVQLIQSGNTLAGQVFDRIMNRTWTVPLLNPWIHENRSIQERIAIARDCTPIVSIDNEANNPEGKPVGIALNRVAPELRNFADGADLYSIGESNLQHYVFKNLPRGTYCETDISIRRPEELYNFGERGNKKAIEIQISRSILETLGLTPYAFLECLFLDEKSYQSKYIQPLNGEAMKNLVLNEISAEDKTQKKIAEEDFERAYARCAKVIVIVACDRSIAHIKINDRTWVVSGAWAGHGIPVGLRFFGRTIQPVLGLFNLGSKIWGWLGGPSADGLGNLRGDIEVTAVTFDDSRGVDQVAANVSNLLPNSTTSN